MANRYFVGDKIKTKFGVGWVRKVTTWRQRIIEMDDYEAVEFSSECKRMHGINYQRDWVELSVEIKGILMDLQASTVELLEGREYDSVEKLEKRSPKEG